jgi:hypothetical protein
MALAIDACWGGSHESGPSLRDTMRLWFGLPPVDDPSAPDTHLMTSAERHEVAWRYWQTGGGREALDTFRTGKATVRYEALTKKLIELEVAKIERIAAEPEASDESVEQAQDDIEIAPRHSTSWRHLALAVSASAALMAALLLGHPWETGATPVPPRGAIVNAQTGSWSMHATRTPAEHPTGLEEGSEVRGCDVTTEHHCRPAASPLWPRVGDIVEFAVRLNDVYSGEVPYLKLETYVDTVSESPKTHRNLLPPAELAVTPRAVWLSSGELGAGPVRTSSPSLGRVFVSFRAPGTYGFQYLPGTSDIYNREVKFNHRLPDGIMDTGIALQHLGEPPTCHPCAQRYIRFVSFRARVIRGTSPGLRGAIGVGF